MTGATASRRRWCGAALAAVLLPVAPLRAEPAGALASSAEALLREARALTARGDLDGAARAYRQALTLMDAEPGAPLALAEPLNELGLWHAARDEPAEADALMQRAQRLLEGEGEAQALALAHVLASRAQIADRLGRDGDARQLNQRALTLLRSREDDGAPVWVAQAGVLNALASQLHRRRRYREAEPLFIEALEKLERAVGPNDARLLPLLENLQALYRSQGKPEATALYARRAEAVRRAAGQGG